MASERSQTAELEARLSRFLEMAGEGSVPDAEAFCEGLSAEKRQFFLELALSASILHEGLDSPLKYGQLIAGRYQLEVPLGSGGFGTVWRAEDCHLGRRVAIKFLSITGDRTSDLGRFRREVQALVRTDCRGVARVHDIGAHEDLFFIVLEYVEGRSLAKVFAELRDHFNATGWLTADILRKALRYSPKPGHADLLRGGDWHTCVARICVEILRAVEAVHGAGIRHRDIKPSNVMLRGGGGVVLVDLGLATHSTKVEPEEGLTGSLLYLAPEQVRSLSSGSDGRTDVYQVGLLLYEFCALQSAFEDCESGEIVGAIRQSAFAKPRSLRRKIPRGLEKICLMALANEPRHRYQTAAGFRIDLERWLDGTRSPVAFLGSGLDNTLLRFTCFIRRHTRIWQVLLGVLIGILLTMAGTAMG